MPPEIRDSEHFWRLVRISLTAPDCSIDGPNPSLTKRYRLFEALDARQRRDGCSNAVVAFIRRAMAPISYRGQQVVFDDRWHDLNEVLAFGGLQLAEDGELRKVEAARTLNVAEESLSCIG